LVGRVAGFRFGGTLKGRIRVGAGRRGRRDRRRGRFGRVDRVHRLALGFPALGGATATASPAGATLARRFGGLGGNGRGGGGGRLVALAVDPLARAFGCALTASATAASAFATGFPAGIGSAARTLATPLGAPVHVATGLAAPSGAARTRAGCGGIGARRRGGLGRRGAGIGLVGGLAGEPVDDPADQAAGGLAGRDRQGRRRRAGDRLDRLRPHGRRALADDALDHRFLSRRAAVELVGGLAIVGGRRVGGRIAGAIGRQPLVVVADPLEAVVRRLDDLVRDQDDLDPQPGFELRDLAPLFVEQVGRDVDRHLGVDGGGALLHRLFLDHPQHVQGGGFRSEEHT